MKEVWCELEDDFSESKLVMKVVRIFKTRKSMIFAMPYVEDGYTAKLDYRFAVGEIHHTIWERTKGNCEFCHKPITEESMHMHEKVHRGQGGEISLRNSVGICFECHREQHSDREPKWGKHG